MEVHHAMQVISQKILPELSFEQPVVGSKEEFMAYISPFISHLLDNDFGKLLQIMYRVDVYEKDFALTLELNGKEEPPVKIAGLIYDRLMLKAKIRAQYQNKNA